MGHLRSRHEHAGPSALPPAESDIEILDVAGLENLSEASERAQLRQVIKGAASAPVKHIAAVFPIERDRAFNWKSVYLYSNGENRLAGFLPSSAFRKEDLRCGAKQFGNRREGLDQRLEEAIVRPHIVIQQQYM